MTNNALPEDLTKSVLFFTNIRSMNVSAPTCAWSIFSSSRRPAQRHSTDHHYAITTILKSWTSVRGLI
jgi:hypothetical protein